MSLVKYRRLQGLWSWAGGVCSTWLVLRPPRGLLRVADRSSEERQWERRAGRVFCWWTGWMGNSRSDPLLQDGNLNRGFFCSEARCQSLPPAVA